MYFEVTQHDIQVAELPTFRQARDMLRSTLLQCAADNNDEADANRYREASDEVAHWLSPQHITVQTDEGTMMLSIVQQP